MDLLDTTLSMAETNKRKRSPSDAPTLPAKAAKTHSNHLQINYLARQYSEILPLISADDPLPSLLSLVADYDGVLQRHESMAGNLGARPLGPILVKRFERLFDGPPRVLKSHGKEGTTVGWLDVVDFAKNKPEQFNLEKMRDGVRVCQFYTKQSRVEISEEDYQLIASGMPQKLIPPQPIIEDEEKELGTLEILEKNLGHVVQLADQVSARARQLNHRLKNRKNAIISRREAEATTTEEMAISSSITSGSHRMTERGGSLFESNGDQRASVSPTSGFVAVNSRQQATNEDSSHHDSHQLSHEQLRNANVTIINGTSLHGASAATRAELLSKFYTNSERTASMDQDPVRRNSAILSRPSTAHKPKPKTASEPVDYASILLNSASPVPIPNTPSSLLPYTKPSPAERFDDSGPYKTEMVARMEQLQRGDRIQPPCDRCRRLHMDCLKNLTACMGCTKKHAKCSWKDVRDEELRDNPFIPHAPRDDDLDPMTDRDDYHRSTPSAADIQRRAYSRDTQLGVRDEELLGEDGSLDDDLDQRDQSTSMIPHPTDQTPFQSPDPLPASLHPPPISPPPHASLTPSPETKHPDTAYETRPFESINDNQTVEMPAAAKNIFVQMKGAAEERTRVQEAAAGARELEGREGKEWIGE